MEEIYDKIIKRLEKELKMENYENVIDELFEIRGENFHRAIMDNEEHQKLREKRKQVENEIRKNNENHKEFLKELEKFEDASSDMGYLTEKLMYKYGLLDGMNIILEGTKHINIAEFIKNDE